MQGMIIATEEEAIARLHVTFSIGKANKLAFSTNGLNQHTKLAANMEF
jgi:hypothetical protein